MYKKIVIFADSLFKNRKRERISFPEFEIQEYENEYFYCPACGQKHAKERFFLPEKFHFSQTTGIVDLIQISYTPSPRGAHSIVVNAGDITSKKDRYEGRNSDPNNLYIPVKSFFVGRENISVVAVKNESNNGSCYDGNKILCDISCGNSGIWTLLISENIKKRTENIEYQKFLHRSCARNLAPSLWKGLGGENFLYNPPLDLERRGSLDVYSFHNGGMDDQYIFNSNIYFLANSKDIAEEKFLVNLQGTKAISCKDGKFYDVTIDGDSMLLDDNTQLETEYQFFEAKKEEKEEEEYY